MHHAILHASPPYPHYRILGRTKRLGASVPPTYHSPHAYACASKVPYRFSILPKASILLESCVRYALRFHRLNEHGSLHSRPGRELPCKDQGFYEARLASPTRCNASCIGALPPGSLSIELLLSATTANSTFVHCTIDGITQASELASAEGSWTSGRFRSHILRLPRVNADEHYRGRRHVNSP